MKHFALASCLLWVAAAQAQSLATANNPIGQSVNRPIGQSTDTLPDGQLTQVVVTAQFTPTDVRETVNTVRVIDRQTIERRAALNLEELLQTEANLRITQDPVLGSAVSINGLQGENVKILVDGVPVVGRLNGSVDAGQLPLNAVQQVEIIQGAQSLLYGSESAAGVVNLVTRKSQLHTFEAEAKGQIESNGFRQTDGRVGVQLGKFLVQTSINLLEFEPTPDTLSRDQLWNPKHAQAARASVRYRPSERLDLRLAGSLFSETVDNLGEVRRPTFKPYAFDDYYHTNRADLTLAGEGWLPGRLFWQTTVGWNQFDRIKNSYRFNFEEEQQVLIEGQQDTSGASGWLTRATLASDRRDRLWNFLVGVENYNETAEGIRIVDSSATRPGVARGNDLGLFGSLKIKLWDQLTLQGGARWTQNRLYGSAVTPAAWLLWQPAPQWQARVSYARGFRSPGLKELYFNFIDINHYVVGNINLQPEHSDNLRAEITWRLSATRQWYLSATASGFYNNVRDRIILSEFGPVQYTYKNLERWKTMGTGLGITTGYGNWVRLRSEVVYTGFYNTFAEEVDTLKTLNWSPDWVNELTINCLNQRLGFTVWHKMTGATPYFFEKDGALNQGKTESWNLLNLSANTSLAKQSIRLSAGVKNLLNTRQVRAGSNNDLGHTGGETRPVHWGRTYFVAATFLLGVK